MQHTTNSVDSDVNCLTGRIQHEINRVVLDVNITRSFSVYFDFIRQLYALFFSCHHYSLNLHGNTLHSPLPSLRLVWTKSSVVVDEEQMLHWEMGVGRALFVHCGVVAVTDEMESDACDSKRVLPLYIHRSEKQGSSGLIMSLRLPLLSKTSDQKPLSTYGLFPGSIMESPANRAATSVTVSASWFDGGYPAHLLFAYLPFIALSVPQNWNCADEYDIIVTKSLVAIPCISWPAETLAWKTRERCWPSVEVIESAFSKEVYVVPVSSELCKCFHLASGEEDDPCTTGSFWQFDFCNAEECLMASLSDFHKAVYRVVLAVVKDYGITLPWHCLIACDTVVKYALFWTMEKSDAFLPLREKKLADCCTEVCNTLTSFTDNKYFPHYFMPQFNILCQCSSATLHANFCHGIFTHHGTRVADISTFSSGNKHGESVCELIPDNHSVIQQLEFLFEHSCELLYIQLFRQLHSTTSVDTAISLHLEKLLLLRPQSLSNEQFAKPLSSLINSSLGTLYDLKSAGCTSKDDANEFLLKAEERLMLSIDEKKSLPVCVTRLAQFLMRHRRHTEALMFLQTARDDSEMEVHGWMRKHENAEDDDSFRENLVYAWRRSNIQMGAMFSGLEMTVLPPQLLPSPFSLAYYQRLGCTQFPVAVLSVAFYVRYLMVGCLVALKDFTAAASLLKELEQCIVGSWHSSDIDDRVRVVYLNLLAELYEEIDDINSALRVLRHSSRILANARNPANFNKLILRPKHFLKRFMKNYGLIVLAVVISMPVVTYMYKFYSH